MGCGEVPGNDFLIAKWWPPPSVTCFSRAFVGPGVFLHGLGHNFGLRHGNAINLDRQPNSRERHEQQPGHDPAGHFPRADPLPGRGVVG